MRSIIFAIAITAATSATAGAAPDAALTKFINDHVSNLFVGPMNDAYDASAVVVVNGGLSGPDLLDGLIATQGPPHLTHKEASRVTQMSADGKTAILAFDSNVVVSLDFNTKTKLEFRALELAVKTAEGWHFIAGGWSAPTDNATVNAAAKAKKADLSAGFGKDRPAGSDTKGNDASVVAAFTKLVTEGIDPTAAAGKTLIVFGSGPGERTVGGAAIVKPWAAAWVHHLDVAETVARVLPSGTTAWSASLVTLSKGTGATAYVVPFALYCVWDKTAAGDWTLLDMQINAM